MKDLYYHQISSYLKEKPVFQIEENEYEYLSENDYFFSKIPCWKIYREEFPVTDSNLWEGLFKDKEKFTYCIPLKVIDSEPLLYVFRAGRESNYRMLFHPMCKGKPFYGLLSFFDFKIGYPVVLVEGIKDQVAVSRFYPYVLAMLGGSLSKLSLALLRVLSNKVYLCLDSDSTGRERNLNLTAYILNKGVRGRSLEVPRPFKDMAEFYYEYVYRMGQDGKSLLCKNLVWGIFFEEILVVEDSLKKF